MKYKVIKHDKLNEEIYIKELDSGLKVFIMPKKGFTKKYAVYTTNYGSNDNVFVPIEEDNSIRVPEGIAHFLEHKLFEEPEGNIFNEFSKLGSYVNAYTNFNQTAYLFSSTDKFYDNLRVLLRFVEHPYFTDENVEKEKGIIEQEIKMYDDAPNWKVFFNCLNGLYHEHPVKIDIAGTVESIRKIDKDTLYKCYNTFYNPNNMILFMVGNVDFSKAIDVIREVHGRNKVSQDVQIKRIYPVESKNIKQKLVEEHFDVSTPLFNIGFKDIDLGYDGDKLLKKNIETNIILDMVFGNSSEFYQDLYNEGLINNTFGSRYVGHKDYGHSILAGESKSPKEVMDKIMVHVKTLRQNGLNEEDFHRTRKKLIGYHLMDFNSLEYIANTFTSYYFNNISLFQYLTVLENINLTDVEERFLKHFTEDNWTLSIVSPSK